MAKKTEIRMIYQFVFQIINLGDLVRCIWFFKSDFPLFFWFTACQQLL